VTWRFQVVGYLDTHTHTHTQRKNTQTDTHTNKHKHTQTNTHTTDAAWRSYESPRVSWKEEKHLTVLRYHGTWSRRRLHYKDRPIEAVQWNNCCVLRIRINQQIIVCFVGRASRYICVIKNQLDTLFILSLFYQSTSTCFGHICSPSSVGILYICNNWFVLCF